MYLPISISPVFPDDFLPFSPNKRCKHNSTNTLRAFMFLTNQYANESVALFECEKYCSLHEKCWGCSSSCTHFCQWSAMEECGDEEISTDSSYPNTFQKPSRSIPF